MRKGLALWSAMLFLAATAAAQDAPGDAWSSAPVPGSSFSLLASASAPAARSSRPGPFERYSWQLGFGYSFVRFNQAFTGQSVSLNGINTSIAHYFNDWMAIEGEAAPTFGSTGGVGSKFLFYGAGVRIADRSGGRIEPWAHAILGGARFFPRAASGTDSVAYEAGGGVDWRTTQQFSFRVQGDWVGTRLFNATQNNLKIAGGFVFNF